MRHLEPNRKAFAHPAPRRKPTGRRAAGLALTLALLGAVAGPAAADPVTLVPACIVFDGGTDSATVIVHNRGTSPVTWQIGLARMARTANGQLRPRGDRTAADTLIEVTPRECLLAPGESRTIRLSLRSAVSLPSGESRSHLFVREKPALTATGDGASGAGAAVPIVLRGGTSGSRWRDEQFRAGSTRGAPVIVILDLEPARPASAI